METELKTYPVSKIARAASLTRQAVYARLRPAGETSAWPFIALPLEWQLAITERGVKRGYKDGEDYLQSLPEPWRSPLPWDQVTRIHQQKALRLQKALLRCMQLRDEGKSNPEIETVGLSDFKLQFGYSISARHWRRLFNRTVERDAGEENWQRLEVYLDERAFRKPKARVEVVRAEYKHRALDETLCSLENREAPTVADREFLWDAVLRHYEQLTDGLTDTPKGNAERRLVKASLAHYLFGAFPAGTLSATEESLRRRFDEKLNQWRAGGRTPAALQDKRPFKSGKFRQADFAEDLKKIRNLAIQLDGNESLAHRMLRERGELSQAFCDHYELDHRANKSAVPKLVRDAVGAEVEMTLPLRRGPWQARMQGPYIPRDWSGVKPGDWYSADDVTWNHYFKEQQPDGRWTIMRGECLVMADLRTGYPLDFLLIPGKYNGEHIRSLVLKVHDRLGLPRNGFYFERGVWGSRLITGDRRQGTPVHWREAENGLCSAGLRLDVKHATTPRAKPIEGLFHILQDRMRCIPGFVGFNERTENFERIQQQISRAHRGDPEALSQFPTSTEWASNISQVLEEFAHDPQNGKMLEGRSPAEAWTSEVRNHPLRQLPEDARYVLSTHQKRLTVRQEGIILTIRGKRFAYYNEHTGPLIGREVLAFYNLELPEILTVCDLNRQNYFSVRRVELPAMSASPEELAEANRLRSAHMAHAKAVFGDVKHDLISTVSRDSEHSETTKELGRFVQEQTSEAIQAKSNSTRATNRATRKAAIAGFEPARLRMKNPEQVEEAVESIQERLARLKAKEAEEANL